MRYGLIASGPDQQTRMNPDNKLTGWIMGSLLLAIISGLPPHAGENDLNSPAGNLRTAANPRKTANSMAAIFRLSYCTR